MMNNYRLLPALWQLHFTTPKGICSWLRAFRRDGTTMMALLRFAAQVYPDRIALVTEEGQCSYRELYDSAYSMAALLQDNYGIGQGMRVAMLCRNHTVSVELLFAVSRLGAHLQMLNCDMSSLQLSELCSRKGYHLVVYDEEFGEKHNSIFSLPKAITSERLGAELSTFTVSQDLPYIRQGGAFTILSGGSSGHYTEATRKPSRTQFIAPLRALIQQIGIHRYESVYIPLPFYHGFGLATLLVSLVMGKATYLSRRFRTEQALALIQRHRIEVIPVVPIMISRLLDDESSVESLRSVRCWICGGDQLLPRQRDLIQRLLPESQLFNLYGTSEAGFFLLASPEMLRASEEIPIGTPISGVQCQLRDVDDSGVGTLWVSSGWAMQGRKGRWQNTGDRVYRTPDGCYYHRGRADRMIVCAGENVSLYRVEQVLQQHPAISSARAYAVPNDHLGQVVGADVELLRGYSDDEASIIEWCRSRLSRSEIPHSIRIGELRVLSTGKIVRQ